MKRAALLKPKLIDSEYNSSPQKPTALNERKKCQKNLKSGNFYCGDINILKLFSHFFVEIIELDVDCFRILSHLQDLYLEC